MKKTIATLAVISACSLCCSGLAETEISVIGTGTVYVPADTCSITLGVSVINEHAGDAQALANQKLSAVREACIKVGISEDAIATSCIQVNVNNADETVDYMQSGSAQSYEAVSSIILNTNDLTIAANVIDAGIEAGADTVNSVTFSLSDPSVYNAQILSAACSDAHAKAEILAESLALNITGVKSVGESYTYAYDEGTPVINSKIAADTAKTVIDGANITVSTTINITYIAE